MQWALSQVMSVSAVQCALAPDVQCGICHCVNRAVPAPVFYDYLRHARRQCLPVTQGRVVAQLMHFCVCLLYVVCGAQREYFYLTRLVLWPRGLLDLPPPPPCRRPGHDSHLWRGGGGGSGSGGHVSSFQVGWPATCPGRANDLQRHQFFCGNVVMLLEAVLAIFLLLSTFVPFHRCVLCTPPPCLPRYFMYAPS